MKVTGIVVCLLFLLLSGFVHAQTPVYFADSQLKRIVEDTLWISDPTPADMLGLINLIGSNRNVTSLTGLETATSLADLVMSYNQISDISMLSGLTNLTMLALSNNRISDISPLGGLTKLVHLDVHDNDIADISTLSGLNKLQTLFIRYNEVSDISALAGLTALRHVDIHGNHCNDLSALAHLTRLEQLHLQHNQIRDISALGGLSSLHTLRLRRNQIRDVSPLTRLHNLRLLDLDWNYDLDAEAYATDLATIYRNNPGIDLRYSPQCRSPNGLYASYGSYVDRIEITWDKVDNGPLYTSYYRVYRASATEGEKIALTPWQTASRFYDMSAEPRALYTYWVQMALDQQGNNPSEFSGPKQGKVSSQPTLQISSTAGGAVTVPGEGVHIFPIGMAPVAILAESLNPDLFQFSGWTGSAVETDMVTDRTQAATTTLVNDNYHLRANFISTRPVLYVDDDAVGDPAPGDTSSGDPDEDGTRQHPFDSIQEAVEVAAEGTSIVVSPGIYFETIDLLGRGLHLTGLDPNGSDYPVIHGNNTAPAIHIQNTFAPQVQVTGFVITQGAGGLASAIHCEQANSDFSHCLIVGNGSTTQTGDVIVCHDSNVTFTHCTIADNQGGTRLINSHAMVLNSILWGNNAEQIHLDETSILDVQYTAIGGGWSGPGNINQDPLFVAPGEWQMPASPGATAGDAEIMWLAGDYHLMSQVGRWDPESLQWMRDAVQSPCIDGGDPTAPLGYEIEPHGDIANMGAYGATAQASLSR